MKIRLVMKSFRSMLVENTLEVIKDVTADFYKIFNELRSVISNIIVNNIEIKFIEQ